MPIIFMNVVTIQTILLLLSSHKIFMRKNEKSKPQLGCGCGGGAYFFNYKLMCAKNS
jgi:hypothetical protein